MSDILPLTLLELQLNLSGHYLIILLDIEESQLDRLNMW